MKKLLDTQILVLLGLEKESSLPLLLDQTRPCISDVGFSKSSLMDFEFNRLKMRVRTWNVFVSSRHRTRAEKCNAQEYLRGDSYIDIAQTSYPIYIYRLKTYRVRARSSHLNKNRRFC